MTTDGYIFHHIQVVYRQDGVFVHTAVPITTPAQSANIIPGRVTIIEKVSLFRKLGTDLQLTKSLI